MKGLNPVRKDQGGYIKEENRLHVCAIVGGLSIEW
jgi:hypothetical protein